MLPTSRALAPFGTTIFATMTRLAQQHGAVNLSQGFPDFDGPEFVKDAAIAAIRREHNQYAPMPGIPSLRAALAARFTRSTAIACDPDTQVIVTAGCTEAIAACMLGLLNPGDEIILFEPFYDSYRACVAMAGATARFVALKPPTHTPTTASAAHATGTTNSSHDASSGEQGRIHAAPFTFDPEALAHAITPKTRAILINTPHNPTGKVFTRAELELIASLCIKHDVIAICDEVYERLLFDTHQHISLATLPGMSERTITLNSIGKTFSFTGWKIGWAIGPAPLIASVRAAHQFLTFAVATPLQHACVEALAREDEAVGPLRALLDRNRSALCPALASLGFQVFQPEG
ncbi:MAG: aminotransferase class I/II-fold pyridoxal phosphate-dependent enzyme, partial [Phycisphaerales bacterium]|nr:aminotransferase class I/II-fold pyridoxal phosphate-dependent enzyme [Phycisphaerales bacterium]